MGSTIFFADVLGFGRLSVTDGGQGAVDALSDVATLLSREHDVARFLQSGTPWTARYGLSDSIFLVADEPEPAARAAARFFFHLAFYNARLHSPVLMRGSIAQGQVHHVPPLFPETATANLVGEGVLEAVLLERSGAKGPRILLTPSVAEAIEKTETRWILEPGPPA